MVEERSNRALRGEDEAREAEWGAASRECPGAPTTLRLQSRSGTNLRFKSRDWGRLGRRAGLCPEPQYTNMTDTRANGLRNFGLVAFETRRVPEPPAPWSKSGQRAVKERSKSGQRAVKERSKSGQRAFKERSKSGQRAVKERSKSGQRAVKERSDGVLRLQPPSALRRRTGPGPRRSSDAASESESAPSQAPCLTSAPQVALITCTPAAVAAGR
jgi:hypothetical protein